MIVRCGACRTQFDVPGGGRFACPACGSVNIVRGPGNGGGAPPGYEPPPPPPPVSVPSPRLTCPECEFSFIVGAVARAKCPNCGADVETGYKEPEE